MQLHSAHVASQILSHDSDNAHTSTQSSVLTVPPQTFRLYRTNSQCYHAMLTLMARNHAYGPCPLQQLNKHKHTCGIITAELR
jgi:hypothetical protein